MSGADLAARLRAAGVVVALTPDGERVALTGTRPPVDLLEAARAHRADLLAHLRGEDPGKGEAEAAALAALSSSPEDLEAVKEEALEVSRTEAEDLRPLTVARHRPPTPEDLAEVAKRPGHCGSCRLWQAGQYWPHMGVCAAPEAWWWPAPPLEIHHAHSCAALAGRGWRPRHMESSEDGTGAA